MQSGDLAIKQQYLISEIPDKGYDTNKFALFLISLKEGGGDINNWTLEELKETVLAYKERVSIRAHEQEAQEEIERRQQENGPVLEKPQNPTEPSEEKLPSVDLDKRPPKKLFYDKYGVDDKEMIKKIQGTAFKKFMEKASGPLKVQISKPEFKTTGGFLGFGSTTQLWFTVRTNILESEVKRTDDDFTWLRNTIVRLNPGFIVPHLKPAKVIAETERREQAARMNMIRMFLEELAKQPILFNTKLVISFLTWSDYERFNHYRKEVDDTNFVRVMSRLPSMDGTLELEVTEENRKFLSGLDKYTLSLGEIYQKLKTDVKDLIKNLEDITITVYTIANRFAEMQQKYSELIVAAPSVEVNLRIMQNQEFSDVLVCLNNVMAQWGKTYHEQKCAIDIHLSDFFSFQRSQDGSVRELMERRSNAEDEYLRFRSALLKKKDKIYPDPTKWQAPQNILNRISNVDKMKREEAYTYMLPKESEQETKLKEWLGYLNKRCEIAFREQLPIIKDNYIRTFHRLGCDLVSNTKPEIEALSRLSTGLLC